RGLRHRDAQIVFIEEVREPRFPFRSQATTEPAFSLRRSDLNGPDFNERSHRPHAIPTARLLADAWRLDLACGTIDNASREARVLCQNVRQPDSSQGGK